MDSIDVAVPAAGSGTRSGQSLPKQFCRLGEKPLVVHPLQIFRDLPWVGRIIVVHSPDQRDADCVTTRTPLEMNLVRGDDIAEIAIPRDELKVINSPQCFRTEVLRECHERAADQGLAFPTETALMLLFKKQVRLVPGPARHFKITTAIDFLLAEAILASERESRNKAVPC